MARSMVRVFSAQLIEVGVILLLQYVCALHFDMESYFLLHE
jgi:hypothetical protein